MDCSEVVPETFFPLHAIVAISEVMTIVYTLKLQLNCAPEASSCGFDTLCF